jgi:hypothetical protein
MVVTAAVEQATKQRAELLVREQEGDVQLHAPLRCRSLAKTFGCVERLDKDVDRLITDLADLPQSDVDRDVVVARLVLNTQFNSPQRMYHSSGR